MSVRGPGQSKLGWRNVPFKNVELLRLGYRIRGARKSLGYNQKIFAAKCGLDRRYLGGVERGERNITFSVLCTICTNLTCDLAALTKGIPHLPSKTDSQGATRRAAIEELEIWNMSRPVVEVQVRAVAPVSEGCAVFLGNEDKVFVMFVDQSVGAAITMFMQGTHKERPQTHDLLALVLRALGAKIDRVVVNDVKDGTYFARLVLSAENETDQKKIIEIDARPSDCIAMATQQLAPIFVSLDVWDEVEDMTEVLRKLQQEDPEQSGEGEQS
jgi:uncharacterized protein